MRITRVEPIVLRLPAVDTARADGTQDAFLVRVHTDEGLVGIGEADTSPYLARTMIEMPSSHSIARGAGELLVGEDATAIDRLWQRLYDGTSYYGRAGLALQVISALDMALWDLAGKARGVPVSTLLGGARVPALRAYASAVMPGTPAAVRELAHDALAAGYTALKLGWGPLGSDPALDEELIRAARDELGPDAALLIDGGQAYDVKQARALLERVADADIWWFEEPFAPDDYESYRRLADTVHVRIAAGEADATIAPFRRLVVDGHVDVLQPDVGRCGGLTVARQVAELAAERHVEVVPHCFATGVHVAASLHFACTLARPTFAEFTVADSPLAGGLLTRPFELRDGRLEVPTGPGLGIELDEELVAHLRVDA